MSVFNTSKFGTFVPVVVVLRYHCVLRLAALLSKNVFTLILKETRKLELSLHYQKLKKETYPNYKISFHTKPNQIIASVYYTTSWTHQKVEYHILARVARSMVSANKRN